MLKLVHKLCVSEKKLLARVVWVHSSHGKLLIYTRDTCGSFWPLSHEWPGMALAWWEPISVSHSDSSLAYGYKGLGEVRAFLSLLKSK